MWRTFAVSLEGLRIYNFNFPICRTYSNKESISTHADLADRRVVDLDCSFGLNFFVLRVEVPKSQVRCTPFIKAALNRKNIPALLREKGMSEQHVGGSFFFREDQLFDRSAV